MTENSNTKTLAIPPKDYLRSPEIMERFVEILGEQRAKSYVSSVVLAVAQSDQLRECTGQSIAVSAMRAATLRLSCDPSTGQAWLIPFKRYDKKTRREWKEAVLVVGYKGLLQMALRTGKYRYIQIYDVKEGQIVEEDWKTGHHMLSGQKTGDRIIGRLLSFALVTGFEKTYYMTTEEIHAHGQKYSKSYNNQYGNFWKDNPDDMEKKTVLRQGLSKWGYFDPHDVMAMSDEIVEELPEEVTVEKSNGNRPASAIIEEMGYDIDEDGNVCAGSFVEPEPVKQSVSKPPAQPQPEPEQEAPKSNGSGRPYAAETVKRGLELKAVKHEGRTASAKQRQLMVMLIDQVVQDDSKRHNVCKWLFGRGSSKEMSDAQVLAAIDWLDPQQDSGGAYMPSDMAAREVNNVYQAAIAEGQPSLV